MIDEDRSFKVSGGSDPNLSYLEQMKILIKTLIWLKEYTHDLTCSEIVSDAMIYMW